MATVFVVVACDTVPLTSPTGSTITLSIDRSVLPLDGQATVTAIVTESAGTAVHNGTVVTFQPSIGSVNPVEAKTVNGVATATFLAGTRSGTGFIHAFSGAARTGSGNTSSGGVEVRVGAAAASGNISVSATPPSVSQSGGTVTVSALVFDAASNPLPGVNVQFVTSAGTLGSTTATTDANGIARTTLSTTRTATVTAIAGAAKGEFSVNVSTAPPVAVDAPTSGTAGTAVPISVTFPAATGTTANQVASLIIDFGDGTVRTFSNVTGSVALTHTYNRAGGYTITAQVVDVAGNTGTASDSIVIAAAALPTVGITASPDTTPAVNDPVTFTITASSTGAPLSSVVATHNGETVYSGTGGGSFIRRFAAGTHVISVSAFDANGNEGRTTITIVAGP